MSSSKDKCEVSKDKHEDQRKMEYFREVINLTECRNGKSKPPLEEYIRKSRLKMQGAQFFYSEQNLALRTFRQFSVFCYRAATQLGFRSLRLLELGISPTALVAKALTLS
ncbi:hypothetical protein F2Q70_00002675 [Brassica cretica]|uniref:Uncharacterized protein n=1 Tax=Brassica cretica TaxID=69181 RepID=A0A3N6THW3_BRACR|nr:hypothetical protein F2Q70_00002675 [Brassica cretica]KAF3567026.1 hypothetical protein DY000_02014265 [Brassica cretica]